MIGGPGSFVVPIREREKFKDAIRTKLVLEIAGMTGRRVISGLGRRAPRASPARSASWHVAASPGAGGGPSDFQVDQRTNRATISDMRRVA